MFVVFVVYGGTPTVYHCSDRRTCVGHMCAAPNRARSARLVLHLSRPWRIPITATIMCKLPVRVQLCAACEICWCPSTQRRCWPPTQRHCCPRGARAADGCSTPTTHGGARNAPAPAAAPSPWWVCMLRLEQLCCTQLRQHLMCAHTSPATLRRQHRHHRFLLNCCHHRHHRFLCNCRGCGRYARCQRTAQQLVHMAVAHVQQVRCVRTSCIRKLLLCAFRKLRQRMRSQSTRRLWCCIRTAWRPCAERRVTRAAGAMTQLTRRPAVTSDSADQQSPVIQLPQL